MKNLNSKGWSLNTMIILVCILFFVIILVSILTYNYGIDKNSPNSIYQDYEEKSDK